jgi:hypothetical protein
MSESFCLATCLPPVVCCPVLAGWIKSITAAELEFGDSEELMTKLDELIEAAPEPDSDEESSD